MTSKYKRYPGSVKGSGNGFHLKHKIFLLIYNSYWGNMTLEALTNCIPEITDVYMDELVQKGYLRIKFDTMKCNIYDSYRLTAMGKKYITDWLESDVAESISVIMDWKRIEESTGERLIDQECEVAV